MNSLHIESFTKEEIASAFASIEKLLDSHIAIVYTNTRGVSLIPADMDAQVEMAAWLLPNEFLVEMDTGALMLLKEGASND